MIQKIRLQNFRNIPDGVFDFSPKITVVVGLNASGKTNLLEAIFFISSGKSFKANIEKEIINEEKDFARVKGLLNEDVKLEVILAREKHKKFLVNGVAKRLIDFAGNFKAVIFRPEDLDLVTSSPSLRRKFLDNVLSLVDREYHRSILSYEKGLRQRNKLLLKIREENLARSQLLFWDQLLIKNADIISAKREEFINFVNEIKPFENKNLQLEFDKSVISEARLREYANEEVASGTTLVGPHRDDFIFKFNKHNLSSFGSRGEQRMGVLWLKLAELLFLEYKTGVKSTLLLDDIFSELDESHRKIVFEISQNQQTIITTADPNFLVDMDELKRIEF